MKRSDIMHIKGLLALILAGTVHSDWAQWSLVALAAGYIAASIYFDFKKD